jgi:hypothetical protein
VADHLLQVGSAKLPAVSDASEHRDTTADKQSVASPTQADSKSAVSAKVEEHLPRFPVAIQSVDSATQWVESGALDILADRSDARDTQAVLHHFLVAA